MGETHQSQQEEDAPVPGYGPVQDWRSWQPGKKLPQVKVLSCAQWEPPRPKQRGRDDTHTADKAVSGEGGILGRPSGGETYWRQKACKVSKEGPEAQARFVEV